MVIYGRDARTGPRSLKHLFSGNYKNSEANRLSGIYELVLKRASEAGSPGSFHEKKNAVENIIVVRLCLVDVINITTKVFINYYRCCL